jgi:hypothetical protein
MSERFGPAPGNARLAQGGQQGWATKSEPRLTKGAPGARLSSGSAAKQSSLEMTVCSARRPHALHRMGNDRNHTVM